VKHNGPVEGDIPVTLAEVQTQTDLQLTTHASVEAQVAALSDDIAYNNHDVEDGLRAGMFTLEDLQKLSLMGPIIAETRKRYPDISNKVLIYEVIREMIGAMVDDAIHETRKRIEEIAPQNADDIRNAGQQVVAFSPEMHEKVEELRDFLHSRMYRHYTVNRMRLKVERIVDDLFKAYMKRINVLPENWQEKVAKAGGLLNETVQARVVCDYIAGMTDRYAIREHERLFDLYWDLR